MRILGLPLDEPKTLLSAVGIPVVLKRSRANVPSELSLPRLPNVERLKRSGVALSRSTTGKTATEDVEVENTEGVPFSVTVHEVAVEPEALLMTLRRMYFPRV